jgi:release factor glutamine methyltransferase
MLINDALALISQKLKSAGINSHYLDSRILLGHCLNLSPEEIIFNRNLSLSPKQLSDLEPIVARRSAREPISHIIGVREFFGYNFMVNSAVLDPRPDSESLIEAVIENFDLQAPLEILELGVGSGCLILTLLKLFPQALGLGIDISPEALKVAGRNADLLDLTKKCRFLQSNWLENLGANEPMKFDLIISNPPYINSAVIASLATEVKDYEPLLALDGGSDGLDCYRQIAATCGDFLKPQSLLIVEIGQNQEVEVEKIFAGTNLELLAIKKDLAGIKRCLIFKKTHENL